MHRKDGLISAANVVRGRASAGAAVVLPLFLVRLVAVDSYGVWSAPELDLEVARLRLGSERTVLGRP